MKGGPDTAATRTIKALEAALQHHRLPYVTIGIQSFYRNPAVRALVALLRALATPDDDAALSAVLLTPLVPGIGENTIAALAQARLSMGTTSIWTLLQYTRAEGLEGIGKTTSFIDLPISGLNHSRKVALRDFALLLQQLRQELAQVRDWEDYLIFVRTRTRFDQKFKTEAAEDQFSGLMRVFAATIQEEMGAGGDLLDVLNSFAVLDSALDDDNQEQGALQIMSIHKSKGLQFHTVIVPGMEDGVLPSAKSKGSTEELLEEGRLCYVALTRAREMLVLGYVPTREGKNTLPPSGYLKAIWQIVSTLR